MQKTKHYLIALIVISLSACVSYKQAHVAIDCLGQPTVDVLFTADDIDRISADKAVCDEACESIVSKIERIRIIYENRIDAICQQIELNNGEFSNEAY